MFQVLGTGKAYQQELFSLKDRSVLSGINHLKNALGLCCGNAPGNYKLKLLATGKAKSHDLSGDPKQTAVLPIVATRKYG
jgi:hypothetical protein